MGRGKWAGSETRSEGGEGGGGKEGDSEKAKAMLRFFADTALGTPKPYLNPRA